MSFFVVWDIVFGCFNCVCNKIVGFSFFCVDFLWKILGIGVYEEYDEDGWGLSKMDCSRGNVCVEIEKKMKYCLEIGRES